MFLARDRLDGRLVARARGGARRRSSGCCPTRAPCTRASSTSSRTTDAARPAGGVGAVRARGGQIELERGEGSPGGRSSTREPAFIRENALDDPRVKYVPELEEERFQSLVAVPILGRAATRSARSPRTPRRRASSPTTRSSSSSSTASLVAGAIENARLYGEMRLRVRELEQLTELAEAIARAEALEELVPDGRRGARALLGAEACHLYLLDPASEERLRLRQSIPSRASARRRSGSPSSARSWHASGREHARRRLARRRRRAARAARRRRDARASSSRRAIASQVAVGDQEDPGDRAAHGEEPDQGLLRGARRRPLGRRARGSRGPSRLRPRAAARRDRGGAGRRRARARALAALGARIAARPPRATRSARSCPSRRRGRGASSSGSGGSTASSASRAPIGVSSVCPARRRSPTASRRRGMRSLGAAVLAGKPPCSPTTSSAPTGTCFGSRSTRRIRDATDRRRREPRRLRRAARRAAPRDPRGVPAAAVATSARRRRRCFVHPNTLRQRLRRIGELTGLDLRRDDWLRSRSR